MPRENIKMRVKRRCMEKFLVDREHIVSAKKDDYFINEKGLRTNHKDKRHPLL
jgi:hypothetical protein